MVEYIMLEVAFYFALVNGTCTKKISVLHQGLGLINWEVTGIEAGAQGLWATPPTSPTI